MPGTGFDISKAIYGDNYQKQIKAKYGLSMDAYVALLQAQNYGCRLCGKPNLTTNGKDRPLAVDHDHKTGRIRGLLCDKHNLMLGHAEDDPTILLKAIQYLKGNL